MKTAKAAIPTEAAEQQKVARWLRLSEIDFFAVPNGGYKNASVARGQQFQGVQRGVPDLFICKPKGGYHGLFIEMKRQKGGRLDLWQEKWLIRLNKLGFYATVCYGANDAIETIKKYLNEEV